MNRFFRPLIAAMIVLGFVIVGMFEYLEYREDVKFEVLRYEQAQRDIAARKQAELKLWPLPRPPELYLAGWLPQVPKELWRESVPVQRRDVLGQRALWMLTNHPDPEVREQLAPDILAGTVSLEIIERPGLLGEFWVAGPGMVTTDGRSNTELQPIFTLNAVMLGNMRSSREAAMVMLVIAHEARHYLDWRSLEDKSDKDYLVMRDGGQAKQSQEGCAGRWRDEHSAHAHECALAHSWGVANTVNIGPLGAANDLCAYSQDPALFSQSLWLRLSTHAPGKRLSECLPVWAELAGHPHPEAFR